jgi:homogentisate 1,2-dioxygenase
MEEARMTATWQRETLSKDILEHVGPRGQRLQLMKAVSSASVVSYSGDVPFWRTDLYAVAAPDATDPAAEPMVLVECEGWRLKLTKRRAPSPYAWRHIDADEAYFVHRGSALFETELGQLEVGPGWFLMVRQGIGYRVVPRSDDFLALIMESDRPLELHPSVAAAEVPLVAPTFPLAPTDGAASEWEERIVTRHWRANTVRPYDPVRVKKVIGKAKLVYGIDVETIPAHSPTAPMPGLPFELLQCPTMELQISKRADPLPFYDRNVSGSEIEFCHLGGADQDTELGYVAAPPGTFYNLPTGIEHAPANRRAPLVNLIWESVGRVAINPAALSAPA